MRKDRVLSAKWKVQDFLPISPFRSQDCEKGARKMGWAHPAVAMEEVLGLVRGFVDVVVLAGGRTSSGVAATWSADEVKKALRWALFFEEVFKDLRDSGQYEDSARELDAALLELTSSPEFPKGLAAVRSEMLSMARVLVVRHFLKAKTMSVESFDALLEAVVEMDIDGICATGVHNACQEYAESILNMNLSCFAQSMNACDGGLPTSSDEPHAESMGNSRIIVKEFQKTLDSALCACLAERGLETLLNSVKRNSFENRSNKPCVPVIPKTSRMIDEFLMWKQWRAKCLSYLLDERTIRVLAGASLIFKAPKEQWMKVFEPLKGLAEPCHSGLVETMELCLLGSITGRWNTLIEGFISHSFCFIPISKKYADLHQCLHRTSQEKFQDEHLNLEEKDILDYARQSLESKPSLLWLLPPALTAAAIPPRSSLFQIYLAQIDKQFHDATPADRKCKCREDEMDQHHCEITERIQCLYAFHIQQLHLMIKLMGTACSHTSTMNRLHSGRVPPCLSSALTLVPAFSETVDARIATPQSYLYCHYSEERTRSLSTVINLALTASLLQTLLQSQGCAGHLSFMTVLLMLLTSSVGAKKQFQKQSRRL
ncbi:uncharacterized protein [Miscanthus floridulus]|uniref:uncharacterized protein isoform X2 n=1 Tax=Miscanthus floridulus TaxID=154761 RepID=UPI00345B13B7